MSSSVKWDRTILQVVVRSKEVNTDEAENSVWLIALKMYCLFPCITFKKEKVKFQEWRWQLLDPRWLWTVLKKTVWAVSNDLLEPCNHTMTDSLITQFSVWEVGVYFDPGWNQSHMNAPSTALLETWWGHVIQENMWFSASLSDNPQNEELWNMSYFQLQLCGSWFSFYSNFGKPK